VVFAGHLVAATPSAAQVLREEPVRLFDGRVTLTADLTATAGARDDEAFFNYTDYEMNALRAFRAGVTALWRAAPQFSALVEVRANNASRIDIAAAYVRVRPVRTLPLDLQVGRIPPVFGAYARHAYEADRIFIGQPLAYQYLTSLRADALPGSGDDLLAMRGRGWRSSFPVGSPYAGPGLPVVSAERWDTGIEAFWTDGTIAAAVSLTQGTLSNPRVDDDNGGKQVAARVAIQPVAAIKVGGSFARGAWIADSVPTDGAHAHQTAVGGDIEWSAGRLLLRSEAVWSRWDVPFEEAPVDRAALSALGTWIEGRYRITPRLYAAVRLDRLGFSRLDGLDATAASPTWDANVRRVETGIGLLLQRNVVWRTAVQWNTRSGGRVAERTFVASQVAWWF
jgi:hypothetical protein